MTSSTVPNEPPAILVVEDDAIIAWDIALQLRSLGYRALGPAATGAQAIELAGSLRPALVLMDIHLRGPMDGIAAALAIRADFDVPSVFLSAFVAGNGLERAAAARPAGYIAKPFTEHDLRAVVASALGQDAQPA
ncbi:MAG: response regulator [Rhodoferax sp.]|nr:response regulator [Rhodoferax sp.]